MHRLSYAALAVGFLVSSPAAAQDQPDEPDPDEEAMPEEDPLESMAIPSTELEPEPEPDAPPAPAPKAKPVAKPAPSKVIVTPSSGPDVLPYDEARPIPDGYALDTRMRKGFIIAGAITFMVPYLSSIAVALRERNEAEEGRGSVDEANAMQALWVPIAGPFIAIGESEQRNTPREIAPLVAAGVVQAAGAGLLLAGFLAHEQVLVKKQAVTAAPIISASTVGVGVTGSF